MKAALFKKKPACRSCRRSSRPCARWQGLGLYGERRQLGVPKLAAPTGNAADLEGENLNALLQRHGISLPKQRMPALQLTRQSEQRK